MNVKRTPPGFVPGGVLSICYLSLAFVQQLILPHVHRRSHREDGVNIRHGIQWGIHTAMGAIGQVDVASVTAGRSG